MKPRDIANLLRETFKQWREEEVTRHAASLAYYAAFSLMPLLLVMTMLSSFLMGDKQAESQVGQLITQFISQTAAQTIQQAVTKVNDGQISATVVTVVSVGALLFAATGLFRQLKSSLNVIWSVPPATPDKVRGFIKDTLLSFLLVMGLGVLLLVVMLINTFLFHFIRTLGSEGSDIQMVQLWQVIGFVMLFLFTTLIFATIYKSLPDAHVVWRDVWVGAVVTAIVFTIGQAVIASLLSNSSMDNLYGTASTLVFVLIWVHISAHIVLLGAEFTQVYANHYGSKIVSTEHYEEEKSVRAELG